MLSTSQIQSKLDMLKGKKEELLERISKNKNLIESNNIRKEKLMKCNKLLSYIGQLNQTEVITLFEHTLSSGLMDMFDDSYGFKFDIKTRGDSSACDFMIHSSQFPGWADIIMCRGKSVQEIVAAIFRIILVKLDRSSRKIVVLDEPFSGLENDRQTLISKFISDICEKFDLQVIVVTHNDLFLEHCNNVINLNEVANVKRKKA